MTDTKNNKEQKPTFMEKMWQGLQDLETLRIRTIVAELKYDAATKSYIHNDGQNVEGIISEIHLATGDIDTRMTEKFTGEFDALREYHQTKEIKGQELSGRTLNSYRKLQRPLWNLVKK